MDVITDPQFEEVTYMMATRLGKSIVIENAIGYYVDHDPSPLMYVLPNSKSGSRWSKLYLSPMIRDNPHLLAKFGDQTKKRSGNKEDLKKFPGGYLVIVSAESPSELAQVSIRIVMLDEIDRYVASAGDEGDPVELAKKRAKNYLDRKYIYSSTPGVEETSRIWPLWEKSDQRIYKVPCPFCGFEQMMVFGPNSKFRHLGNGFLKFDRVKNRVTEAVYVCGNCKKDIPEYRKREMLAAGQWVKQQPEAKTHAGFHANTLYSPWTTWKEVAQDFVNCEKKYNLLKTFVNTTLGEPFTMQVNYNFTDDKFLSRRENYTKIPKQVIIQTIGIDMQDNRLEGFLWGWGKDEESWFLERFIAMGSPGDESTWDLMAGWIFKTREYENGYPAEYGKLGGVYAVGVDTRGHFTPKAYEFVQKYASSRVFGVAGVGGFGKTFVKLSQKKGRRQPLFTVGVDAGKELIYHRLELQVMKDEKGNPLPTPGAMHFPMSCDKAFFDGLTCEIPVIEGEGNNKKIKWVQPPGKPNEPLDGTNYALAALTLVDVKNWDMMQQTLQQRMEIYEKQVKERGESGAAAAIAQEPITPPPAGSSPAPVIQIEL